jgi:hypothetical protein
MYFQKYQCLGIQVLKTFQQEVNPILASVWCSTEGESDDGKASGWTGRADRDTSIPVM